MKFPSKKKSPTDFNLKYIKKLQKKEQTGWNFIKDQNKQLVMMFQPLENTSPDHIQQSRLQSMELLSKNESLKFGKGENVSSSNME